MIARAPRADGAPALSVLLPVHNAAPFLPAALDSVLAQDFGDFELLALDDGSTDGSAAILQAYAARDPRVRSWSRENRGLVATLNELLDAARAPLVARMDADDVCLPGRFTAQVAFLADNPDHALVGGLVEWMNEDGLPIGVVDSPTTHERIDARNLEGACSIWHPTVTARCEALRAVGGYDPAMRNAEDLDLWLRVAERGRIANLPRPVLRYRLSSGGISGARRDEQREWTAKVCAAACARRGVSAVFAYRDWRPGGDADSRLAFALRYGWMAWRHGNRATVRRFAREALTLAPLSPASWRLALFGLLRRPPDGPTGPDRTAG